MRKKELLEILEERERILFENNRIERALLLNIVIGQIKNGKIKKKDYLLYRDMGVL